MQEQNPEYTPNWPTLIPLDTPSASPSPFPTSTLPGWCAQMVSAVSEFTQTPDDLAGCVALSALSTALGGRARVRIRGSWSEPVNLYLLVSLPPGSRKSAVFATMTDPLLRAEQELAEKAAEQIVAAQLQQEVAVRDAEKARSALLSCDDPTKKTSLTREAVSARALADELTVPPMPRLIADDVTPEAVAALLAEQGGRLSILSAEGGIFATIAGRYSSVPNLEAFLKAHAGDMFRVDRRHAAPQTIEHPALTLGLVVQPEILSQIAQMPGFRGRGLLARFLYAIPENTVGNRRINPPEVEASIADAYTQRIHALTLSWAQQATSVFSLDDEAATAMQELEEWVEPQLAPDGAWAHCVDWGSKYCGAVARIAGLLHLAEENTAETISRDTFERACTLGEYFTSHALTAFTQMGADPVREKAAHILTWLSENGRKNVSTRELFSALARTRFPRTKTLEEPLRLLEEHGYIQSVPAPSQTGQGRPPSPRWAVRPGLST